MANARRIQFSLLTLLLFVTIVALLLSNVVMMRWLNQARSEAEEARVEVEKTRRQFGYLRIDDPNLIHVARIEGDGTSTSSKHRYRLYIPPGHGFLLQVAETDIPDIGRYETPQPARTLSMNPWREGANTILEWDIRYDEHGVPHLLIATDYEQLFDYPIKAWKQGAGGGGMHDAGELSATPQETFRPDEEIRFMFSRDNATKRGVVFWMEPLSRRYPQQ